MNGRDPMKGRHSVGVQRVNTGKTRGGQSEPASNKVKTGTNTEMKPRAGVLANQAKTSLDLQNRLTKAPQPFTVTGAAPTQPTPPSPRGAKPGMEPKNIYAGKSGNTVGQSNPGGRATGYSKLPNQSFQIGGRTSVARGPRKAGSNASGYPSKRNASFYGE
jgi:hypothetical protein